MPSWEEIQGHAKRMIDEGLRILRTGMTEASYLADVTAKAANLEVTLRRNRLERYKAVHEIGKFVCEEVEFDHTKDSVRLTSHIKKKMEQVIALDEEAKQFEAQIAQLTIIRKDEAKQLRAKPEDKAQDKGPDAK
jgi:hypothetical protein